MVALQLVHLMMRVPVMMGLQCEMVGGVGGGTKNHEEFLSIKHE